MGRPDVRLRRTTDAAGGGGGTSLCAFCSRCFASCCGALTSGAPTLEALVPLAGLVDSVAVLATLSWLCGIGTCVKLRIVGQPGTSVEGSWTRPSHCCIVREGCLESWAGAINADKLGTCRFREGTGPRSAGKPRCHTLCMGAVDGTWATERVEAETGLQTQVQQFHAGAYLRFQPKSCHAQRLCCPW